jgi:L-lactate dehydrogenase complex protein LldG
MPETQPVNTMKEKATAAQTIIADAGDLDEVFRYAVDLTEKQGGKTLAAPGLSSEEQAALKALCDSKGIELITGPLRSHLETIHTALTPADWGVAETGTLVLDSTSEDTRIATMLSETHVAYLPVGRVLPDAMALEGTLDALMKSPPRYLAFISGASRTADIERVLTIGVHGPQELHLLFIKEESER